jgi:NSS family neurotransmitter:Na+ symporter
MKQDVNIWTSRFAFLYSAAAASIGLGSLWRFPYVAGTNGGGAFVLMYILFIALLCAPIIIAEMVIGKKGGGSTVASLKKLVSAENASGKWRCIGWISLLVPFFGLSMYSVIAGWCVEYARLSIFKGFDGVDGEASKNIFTNLVATPSHQLVIQALFIAAIAWVVGKGLHAGIERISRIKMTALFIVLLGIVAYNAASVGLMPSIDFMFKPDFSKLTGAGVLAAFGQALFSTGIGVGVLMTYSAYLPKGISVPQSGVLLSVAVVAVALLAGLAIFPTVLHFGLAPAQGPNLIFVTMPVAFAQMPGGHFIAIVFFCLFALAAFTSAVGLLEPVVAWIMERTQWSRQRAAAAAAFGVWVISLPSLLSFNVLKDVFPLDFIPFLKGKTVFDILDFGIANVMLPLNGLLIALFAGWVLSKASTAAEFKSDRGVYQVWRFALCYASPLAIAGLMWSLLAA